MDHSRKLLLSAILLLLVQGHAGAARPSERCSPSSVVVEQANTGEKAGFDPVFEVTVRNRCRCSLRAVFLRSEGFASSMAVDPRLFRRDGRDYLVGDGRRIESAAAMRFRYAWDRAFRMVPASIEEDCS